MFNFVFSDACRKRNSYKNGLIKSLLDDIFDGKQVENGIYYTYEELFGRFAENYWNLVIKYNLRQMQADGKSVLSKIEVILKEAASKENALNFLEFESIHSNIDIVRSMCMLMARGAVISMIAVILILPALLFICDRPICAMTAGMRRLRKKNKEVIVNE